LVLPARGFARTGPAIAQWEVVKETNMNKRTSIFSVLFLASASSLAFAQSQEPVPVEHAPPTQAATSTMQGQLVKVGERNNYEYDFKRVNISTNPLGFIFGSYGAAISYAPTSIVAVRLDANYFAPPSIGVKGLEVGIGAPIYFKKMYNGLFLEPGVTYRRVTDDDSDASANVVGPSVSLGYHWYWDSGLNASMAFGAGRNFANNDDDAFSDLNDVFATGYLRFGYAF